MTPEEKQEKRIRKIVDDYPLLSYQSLVELICNCENIDIYQCMKLLRSYSIYI